MNASIRSMFLLAFAVFPISASAFYDPAQGRWCSRDPIAEKGGMNLYVFLKNSPTSKMDRLGLSVIVPLTPDSVGSILGLDPESEIDDQTGWPEVPNPLLDILNSPPEPAPKPKATPGKEYKYICRKLRRDGSAPVLWEGAPDLYKAGVCCIWGHCDYECTPVEPDAPDLDFNPQFRFYLCDEESRRKIRYGGTGNHLAEFCPQTIAIRIGFLQGGNWYTRDVAPDAPPVNVRP